MRSAGALFTVLTIGMATGLATGLAGQATVLRIVDPSGSSVDSTELVQVTQLGSIGSRDVVTGLALQMGDELSGGVAGDGDAAPTIVVLACSDSVEIALEGTIRAVYMPRSSERSCFVNLLAGTAHVQGDASTGLGSGDVEMGALRTRYSLTVTRSDQGPQQDAQVFEGEVDVSSATAGSVRMVEGEALIVAPHAPLTSTKITMAQVNSAASLYARIDASRTDAADRDAAYSSLVVAHTAVLASPSNASRLRLLSTQLKHCAISPTSIYHLNRIEISNERPGTQALRTNLLGTVIYSQTGNTELAASRFQALQQFDPQTVNRALQVYALSPQAIEVAARPDSRVITRVDPAVANRLSRLAAIPDSLRVTADATPNVIASGESSRIVVTVTNRTNTLVEGVDVTVSTGGGCFEGGGTTARGSTDANGVFAVGWMCPTCAPGYGFDVSVSREGYVSARTSVRLRVR